MNTTKNSFLPGLGLRSSNYDKTPSVAVPGHDDDCTTGWDAIGSRLRGVAEKRGGGNVVLAVECYTGLHHGELISAIRDHLRPDLFINVFEEAFRREEEIEALVAPYLGGDDPVFGYITRLEPSDFLDPERCAEVRRRIAASGGRLTVVYGTGASLCCDPDILVYADMPRWEEQLRQRRGEVGNLGVSNKGLKASLQYKRSFFIDWRACDKLKKQTLSRWDFLLDTCIPGQPKLVSGGGLRAGLRAAAARPFRVVPFFDPGPWGGQWMREVCDLPDGPANYAWCFDCVPEENSLLLQFGAERVEIPSIDLVFAHPEELLGTAVYGRFGAEFPIRFDFLDTMGGGNLSFQVHPLSEYIREHFGMAYTQDESYYLLDAEPGAVVYLGCKDGTDPDAMFADLEAAQRGGKPFDDARFCGSFPSRKHDHFLIPAGTLHCSGAGSMVLEISATPYIFTFKLWDWNRLGLDGKPRPINLAHGRRNVRWDRDESYARRHLVNRNIPVAEGGGWREECTGLHEAEFIETRRHWFTGTVPHNTGGGVNVLNLVEGAEAIVESPTGAFAPYVVHYAESFIIPASVGDYTIRPHGPSVGRTCATLKAFVRCRP